jgi:uncharacterized protein YidB (DUF937 family)
MGLFDVIGSLLGRGGQGGQAGLPGTLINMLQQPGMLQSILSQLNQGGLGQAAQSWVGTGANTPVTGQQLGSALGPEIISMLEQATGSSGSDLLGQLAQHLPNIVSGLTPNGQVPHGDELEQLGGNLLQNFLGKQA